MFVHTNRTCFAIKLGVESSLARSAALSSILTGYVVLYRIYMRGYIHAETHVRYLYAKVACITLSIIPLNVRRYLLVNVFTSLHVHVTFDAYKNM